MNAGGREPWNEERIRNIGRGRTQESEANKRSEGRTRRNMGKCICGINVETLEPESGAVVDRQDRQR